MQAGEYVSTYIFPVASSAVARFLEINARAAIIYKRHGTTDSSVLELADGAPRFGCIGLAATLELRPGERAFLARDIFRDRAHCEAVVAAVDADPEIARIFGELQTLVEFTRVLRAEWASVPLPD